MSDGTNEGSWRRIERWILLGTFMCTIVVGAASLCTTNRTLEITSIDLRPWISVDSVDTWIRDGKMTVKFDLINVGKVPAFFRADVTGRFDGRPVGTGIEETAVGLIMPGQNARFSGLIVKGEPMAALLGEAPPTLSGEIRITYGNDSDADEYLTMGRYRFRSANLPRQPGHHERIGLWVMEEADYK